MPIIQKTQKQNTHKKTWLSEWTPPDSTHTQSQNTQKTTSVCPTWRKFICSFGQPSACIRFSKAKVKLTPRKRSRSLVRYVIGATRWLPVYRVSKAVQNVSSSICVCAAEHTVTVCRQSRCFLFFFSSGLRSTEAATTSWTEKKSKQNETKLRDCRDAFATAHVRIISAATDFCFSLSILLLLQSHGGAIWWGHSFDCWSSAT